jgi:methylaspartate ammonia-lyase
MTRIVGLLAVPATAAGYAEDLAALEARYVPVGERYTTAALTPGFRAIREVAEAVSIGVVLDSGQVAWGDCVAGECSGLAGRAPVFRTRDGVAAIEGLVAPALEGRELGSFRELAALVEGLGRARSPEDRQAPPAGRPDVADSARRALLAAPFRAMRAASRAEAGSPAEDGALPGGRLHPAVRYGASQALLAAMALDRGTTMAEVIAREWGLPWNPALVPPVSRPCPARVPTDRVRGTGQCPTERTVSDGKDSVRGRAQRSELSRRPVPLHAQCRYERQQDAEKMIVRRIASLPHALVEDLAEQVGLDGGKMTRYIRWLRDRIARLGGEDYRPTVHLDLNGALGRICDHQPGRMLGLIYGWKTAAGLYPLRLESPVFLGSREAQIEAMRTLKDYVRMRGLDVQLVAGEWVNSMEDVQAFLEAGAADAIQVKMPDLGGIQHAVDALLACKAAGVGAFLGGSDAETDLSARVAVHVALAADADLLMARPGMGVDEAISLAENEMARTLATIESRAGRPSPRPIRPAGSSPQRGEGAR